MLRLIDFRFFFTECTSHYNALCQSVQQDDLKRTEESEDDSVVNNNRYMYTCRCPDGYGYENCTKAIHQNHTHAAISVAPCELRYLSGYHRQESGEGTVYNLLAFQGYG